MQTSHKYVIAKENMFISNILSACRQVTNMLQQKKTCSYIIYSQAWRKVTNMLQQKKIYSYLIYSQHVDKSQICYCKTKYVHILYNLSMQTSHKYVIAKQKMFISNILSACTQVTNILQQKKICSYLIYSQHADK